MHGITFHGIADVRYETVSDPQITADTDAIVRVETAAICGSDLHIYHGRETGLDVGTVMGHEFVGYVVETGDAVENIRPGMRVVSPFSVNCGNCYFCNRRLTARCPQGRAFFGWVQSGEGLQGAQAEYVRVPFADATLVAVPDDIASDLAILAGDNFAAGYFCAEMAEVTTDGVYAVIGCGVVGLLAILAARDLGAGTLIAVDPVPYRRDLALRFGASVAVDPNDAASAVHAATAGRGADAVLEAVGLLEAQRLAIDLIRPCGILAVVGMHTAERFAFSPAEAYDLNLTYKTGRCPARVYIERLFPLLRRYQEQIASLVTHRMPLEAGPDAYRVFDRKDDGAMKILLKP